MDGINAVWEDVLDYSKFSVRWEIEGSIPGRGGQNLCRESGCG